jgi:hypothetical protein
MRGVLPGILWLFLASLVNADDALMHTHEGRVWACEQDAGALQLQITLAQQPAMHPHVPNKIVGCEPWVQETIDFMSTFVSPSGILLLDHIRQVKGPSAVAAILVEALPAYGERGRELLRAALKSNEHHIRERAATLLLEIDGRKEP